MRVSEGVGSDDKQQHNFYVYFMIFYNGFDDFQSRPPHPSSHERQEHHKQLINESISSLRKMGLDDFYDFQHSPPPPPPPPPPKAMSPSHAGLVASISLCFQVAPLSPLSLLGMAIGSRNTCCIATPITSLTFKSLGYRWHRLCAYSVEWMPHPRRTTARAICLGSGSSWTKSGALR